MSSKSTALIRKRIRRCYQRLIKPVDDFHEQLKAKQRKRRLEIHRTLALKLRSSLTKSSINVIFFEPQPISLGNRFLSDDKLIALALEIRQLPEDEYNQLQQLLNQRLTAHPVGKPMSPNPSPLQPRRIPFPHPLPLFSGVYGASLSPCVIPMTTTMQSLLCLLQKVAQLNPKCVV